MKKLISLALALIMVFSLATVAFAVENETNGETRTDGSIVITGATDTYTYKVYKLLHLETYNNDNGAYIYKVESKWETFMKSAAAAPYIAIDPVNGYVTWVAGADVNDFAEAVLKYADENGIAPEAESSPEMFTATGITFSGLTLGYYLVDTSMGALCGLNTTKPEAHISVKNGVPTVDKKVEEDSHVGTETAAFGDTNTADIGQIVNFDVTIEAQAGADKYIYHDDMDEGLTLIEGSFALKHHNPSKGSSADVTLIEGTHYTLDVDHDGCAIEASVSGWNCSFAIIFKEDFLKTVAANDKIYITYSAKLNDKAVVGAPGNKNSAVVNYGDNHRTEIDTTTTYTYGFEIFKTDAAGKPLNGAEFKLLNYTKDVMTVYYNAVTKEYRVGTMALENEEERNVITIENENGLATVKGLDNGTYYLRETKAPNGYTLLTEDKEFIISGSNLYADRDAGGAISVGASVHVENNRGVTLPSTGATGTMLFITFGMFVVLGTGVLLVTKKRMSMIVE